MPPVVTDTTKGVFLTPEAELKKRANMRVPLICGFFVLLTAIGMFNLYSASIGDAYFYAQLKRLVLGFITFGICGWLVPIRQINSYGFWIYAMTCILLLTVLALGHSAGGSQRWIHIGSVGIQPSEFAKVAVAIAVAKFFFLNRQNSAYQLRDLWPVMLLVGIVFGLIFKQPDLGTAGICLLIAAAQIAFIRIDLRSIGIVALSFLGVAVIGWNFLLKNYQKLRILNLLNPNLDPHGSGYNSIQSLVAIGSGGLFGKGFLQGTQTQLEFLPARHTDFVFSVFAEEHGFWGGAAIFVMFGLLTYLVLEIARQANDTFSGMLAIGIGALIFIEFTINVSMVLGMFPVVGMPLPFFSYGGSSLITISAAMGLLVAIDRHSRGSKDAQSVQVSI